MEKEATGQDEKEVKEVAPEPADEDTGDFVPGFLPQGIETENKPPENMGETPFAPLPPDQASPCGRGCPAPADPKNRRPLSLSASTVKVRKFSLH